MKSNDSKLKMNNEDQEQIESSEKNSQRVTAAHIEAVMPRKIKSYSLFKKPNSRLKYLGWFNSAAWFGIVIWIIAVMLWVGGVTCFVLKLVEVSSLENINNGLYISGCALLGAFALLWIINCIVNIVSIVKTNKYIEFYDNSLGKKLKFYFIFSIFLPIVPQWLIIDSIYNYAENHIPSIYDLLDFERLEPIIKHDGDKVIYICPICGQIMDESGLTNEIGNADEHLHNHIVENKNINNVYQSEDELTDDYLVTEETYDNIKINDNDNSSDTILVAKPINKQKRTLTKTIVTTTTITYEAFDAPKDMNDCGTEIARTTKIEEILADGDEVIGTTISLGDQIDQQNVIVSDFKGESIKFNDEIDNYNDDANSYNYSLNNDEVIEEEQEEKVGFWKRLFGKKNKEEPEYEEIIEEE